MKTKTLKIVIFFCLISLIDIKSQPYIYFNTQLQDTTYEQLQKIFRFNIVTNSIEDFLPQQPIGKYAFPVWEPTQTYLNIEVHKWSYFLYNCLDTSINFDLHDLWGLHFDEMLYSPQINKLYIFSDYYAQISEFDILSGTITSQLKLGKTAYPNLLIYPSHCSFFSSENDRIYIFNVDTNDVDQVWTYSLESNQIINKQSLLELGGHLGSLGYKLVFGRNGKGIIQSYPAFYGNPDQDFYYKLYDFDADTSSPFIYHDGECEAYFTGNGEFILIFETYSDTLNDSLSYYHTGLVKIYNSGSGELIKTLNMPVGGFVYAFDCYPNNIYYVIDIEEPTRQIYTLKMDSIFNVLNLTSLNPSSAIVNSQPFTLTVYGYGFDTLSTVYFNDTAKTTTFISDSVLTAEILTSDISTIGNYPVWVTDEWSTSDTLIFAITAPPPVLISISPALSIPAIGRIYPIDISAAGDFFTDSSIVYFNGVAKPTQYISDSVLIFTIENYDVVDIGEKPAWVNNYGSNSDTAYFSVVEELPESVLPILECVEYNGAYSYTAYFGYNNNNDAAVYIPVGGNNMFSPYPNFRGQPLVFLPGIQTNVFSVEFDGKGLTWTLIGESVTADYDSTPCP
ncbi:MAG: hypothetical protein R6W68_13095 [Ignavibacteriaceae bacterium]